MTAYEMRISTGVQTCALPISIAETGAIIDYILEKHGAGRLVPPAGSDEKLRFTYWLHYAEGSAMPLLLLKLIFLRLPGQVPGLLRPIVGKIGRASCRERVCQYV